MEVNDKNIDNYINNYIDNLPKDWTTLLDMKLAMKNAMIESLSTPNKYLEKDKLFQIAHYFYRIGFFEQKESQFEKHFEDYINIINDKK